MKELLPARPGLPDGRGRSSNQMANDFSCPTKIRKGQSLYIPRRILIIRNIVIVIAV